MLTGLHKLLKKFSIAYSPSFSWQHFFSSRLDRFPPQIIPAEWPQIASLDERKNIVRACVYFEG